MLSQSTKQWMSENEYDIESIDKVGKYGNTALMKAVREGRSDITKELLEAGAALEIRNIDGNTALWNASFGQDYECVKLLVEAGIELDSKNDNGVTALMYCASAGKTDMVKLLLEYKANKEITNLDDFKAIDLAANAQIYRLLK
ncbi:MAG: ankyrin repeat domain-containing protein [Candidatus Marinarcus sp.]|uniref:ankyrin repeat domain-containing protein n=1 Tax=Candidatus Marinarcus sp. TaxID=3100987 RepID=UPI003B00D66D